MLSGKNVNVPMIPAGVVKPTYVPTLITCIILDVVVYLIMFNLIAHSLSLIIDYTLTGVSAVLKWVCLNLIVLNTTLIVLMNLVMKGTCPKEDKKCLVTKVS
jgi:hypothetical protein